MASRPCGGVTAVGSDRCSTSRVDRGEGEPNGYWGHKILHDRNYVHGDLRESKLLITDDLTILDFDWCGNLGTARYLADAALIDIDTYP